jgi:hypothetical protein
VAWPGGEHVDVDPTEIADLPQNPYVERHRPSPSDPAPRTVTLLGFLADSGRPGTRRLYFDGRLNVGAEFKTEDVVAVSEVPRGESPFEGETATEVTIREGAQIEFVQARTTDDIFDIDCRCRGEAGGSGCYCPCDPPIAELSHFKGCKK